MGIELIIYAIVMVALAAYQYMQAKKNAGTAAPIASKANPSTVAARGAYIPRVIGLRKVPATVLWAGNRVTITEKQGSGDAEYKVIIYYENGMHALVVGPAFRLLAIQKDGRRIWKGPITRDSHPSGTQVFLGEEGSFIIYWGERDQPANATLGDSSRIGIESSWPSICYIQWHKRLGESAVWGDITYDVEVRPEESGLVDTSAWNDGTLTLQATTFAITNETDAVSWPTTRATLKISGRHLSRFAPGRLFRIVGNAHADGDFTVFSSSYSASTNKTTITITENFTGGDATGTIAAYDVPMDSGANGAHVIYELLFADWPLGLALDPAEFDIDSLEEVGTLLDTEAIRTSIHLNDGEEAESALGALLGDLGLMMPFDVTTGLWKFVAIREPSPFLPNLSVDATLKPTPETTTNHYLRRTDQLSYTYNDRALKFKENVYSVDDDSQSDEQGVKRSRPIEMPTVTDWATASIVGERRAMEELSNQSKMRLFANRDARSLIPGDRFTADVLSRTLMLADIRYLQGTSKTELGCLLDFYGLPAPDWQATETGADDDDVDDSLDPFAAFNWIELPRYLSNDGAMKIAVLAVRNDATVERANVYFSPDGVTYTKVGEMIFFCAGGVLLDALTATDSMIQEQGPRITIAGPDIGNVEDLSTDEPSWRSGRQLAVIGAEWFHLREVTSLSSTIYRLDGLVRARYGSVRAAHAIGDGVFILRLDDIPDVTFEDLLIVKDELLYVIGQPLSGEAESIPTDELSPVSRTIDGLSLIPLNPSNLRNASKGLRPIYSTGEDLNLEWSFRSLDTPKTGAGMYPGGTIAGPSAIQGSFTLEFLTSLDVVVRTVTNVLDNDYVYPNATLLSDYGSEPATLKVRVTNVNGGYSSASVTLTLTKV